ncbi:hypothetical protein [Tepidibacter formicigenes]|uniref:Uncharacterized protein n=1 Tax=Tepidibacter formicigenes DSM 15518 TaxID=1123349 RepID=A0A1M6MUZ1_9FIRM|nr:hypothetical protein [Tepidibacter formicigenes]SHJ87328.1 hypothetical protein SAMN02744037_01061 [Tepidibacter formicigenes DSM 15518]
MKRIIDEFIIFTVVFPGILLIAKFFFKDLEMLSYHNILLIFILSFINIVLRHVLIYLKDKYRISPRNFELIRRLGLLAILSAYFYFKN